MDPAGEALGLTSSGHGGCSEHSERQELREHSERQELRQPEAARGRLRRLAQPGRPGPARPSPASMFLLGAAGPSGIFQSLVANIVANIVANSQTLFFA